MAFVMAPSSQTPEPPGKPGPLIEPHHDLSFDILTSLIASGFYKDRDAYKKVIYLDWGNGGFVPFNFLKSKAHPDTIAKNTLDAMMRVWPELRTAPAFQTFFDAGVKVLIANNLPLTYLYELFTIQTFRNHCLSTIPDTPSGKVVHLAFDHYTKLGRDQEALVGSTLRRAYLLTSNYLARLTFGQPENVLDFRSIMDEGRAFIINLGNVGDLETRKLLGAMLMVQIEQAALSRSEILPEDRTPCTLLVDEWPSFAAQQDTISHILSQTRKFNLHLYLAAQSLAQVDSTRLVGALENCKMQVAFGLGRDSAATQARHIGAVDPLLIREKAHTVETDEPDHLPINYFPTMEQFEAWTSELQNLKPREAYVKLEGKEAVKIRTLKVDNPKVNPAELAEVLTTYKKMYQKEQWEAEQAIASVATPIQNREPVYKTLFDKEEQ